jgi:acetyl-CoA acetyltransferase
MQAFNTTLSNGQTSGLDAIQYAAQFIRLGRADTVIAGAVEESASAGGFAARRLRTNAAI